MQSSCCYFDPSLDPPSLICGTILQRNYIPKGSSFGGFMYVYVIYIIHFWTFWGLLNYWLYHGLSHLISFSFLTRHLNPRGCLMIFRHISISVFFMVFLCLFEGSTFAFFPQRSSCWNEGSTQMPRFVGFMLRTKLWV